jgi:hypothetical protein
VADDKKEEDHHGNETQKGGAQFVDQLIDMLFIQAHMHGPMR